MGADFWRAPLKTSLPILQLRIHFGDQTNTHLCVAVLHSPLMRLHMDQKIKSNCIYMPCRHRVTYLRFQTSQYGIFLDPEESSYIICRQNCNLPKDYKNHSQNYIALQLNFRLALKQWKSIAMFYHFK